MSQKELNIPSRYPQTRKTKIGESFDLESLQMDKATKRVLAPYLRTIRRSQKEAQGRPKEKEEFSYYLQKKPITVLQALSEFLSDSVDLPSLLHETADVLKSVTNSTGVSLYMVDIAQGEICQHPRNISSPRHRVTWKIGTGKTVAAYVAYHKEFVILDDVLGDERFPLGVGWHGPIVKAVLCVPVVTPDDDCIAVIELFREANEDVYNKTDLQIVVAVTGWMGAAIHQNQQRLALQKQQELNEYLLELTKHYFADIAIMDRIISEIVVFAKATLGAERGSFFIIDPECDDELVADLFDESLGDDGCLYKRKLKIRMNKDRGIAGLVAKTGKMVNIKDAYKDPRFNKDVDLQTGFITRSILCMPIMGKTSVLGVVQLVNKKNAPCFTKTDENIFKTFSVYCALALNFSRLQEQMRKIDTRNDIKTEMLIYHMRPCIHDTESVMESPELEQLPEGFATFSWYVFGFEDIMPQMCLYMLHELASDAFVNLKISVEFVLTMRKSYRLNPYHNFEHAFNVCHCMYNILLRNRDIFTPLEQIGLMVASIGHDVDHPGVTNNFIRLIDHSISRLYSESQLENHHFQVTMFIIHSTKLFDHFSPEVFRDLTQEIHDAIIATDLAIYFRCRAKILGILNEKEFDWTNGAQRILLKSIMMTTCDLSGQCKPFNVTKRITENVYREFYRQGDVEKSMGQTPLSMMDREKQYLIPEDQVQFISAVCMPCVELLVTLLPNCFEIAQQCRELRDQWKEIIELKGVKVWKPEESIIKSD